MATHDARGSLSAGISADREDADEDEMEEEPVALECKSDVQLVNTSEQRISLIEVRKRTISLDRTVRERVC